MLNAILGAGLYGFGAGGPVAADPEAMAKSKLAAEEQAAVSSDTRPVTQGTPVDDDDDEVSVRDMINNDDV